MSPLTLTPLPPLSSSIAEINMQNLMLKASNCYESGRFKISYELYIKALLSAIKELQQLQFIDQCSVQQKNNNMDNVFSLAHTCLRHAKAISAASKLTTATKSKPKVPPKPNCLKGSISPPPLPMRPTHSMLRTRSDFVKKSSNLCIDNSTDITITSDNEEDGEDDDDAEDDEDEEVFEDDDEKDRVVPRREQPIVNSNHNKKVAQQQQPQKKVVSSTSLKVITSNKRKKKELPRRSSTSNISSIAPSSPSITNAVKSFLSLPGGASSSATISVAAINNNQSGVDDLFLLSNGIIDPQILVAAQTSHSDNTLQQQTSNSNYLPMIPQAPLVTVYQSLQKKLDELSKTDDQFNQIQTQLNRVRNIHMSATTVPTILQFHPIIIAYQLTLIDSTIFRTIPQEAILSHSPKTPHPSIVASTDFFNYLTRLIEHAILLQQDASGRAQHMNHWIKVAGKCHELKNYQTLKAVISALGTPPIQRLKRSWSFIPKKSMNLLEDLGELMSEASNYGKYRTRLGLSQDDQQQQNSVNNSKRKNSFSKPTVPFLGIFIHDMTYLVAALSKKPSNNHNSQWKATSNSNKTAKDDMMQDVRVSELLKLFRNLQRSPPYSPNVSSALCTKDINNKNRKRKISHALTRSSAVMKAKSSTTMSSQYDDSNDSSGEVSIEMQQCLVTQYLLTRSWVSEKTVDELSLLREPTKTARSSSVTDVPQQQNQPQPPRMTSSVSLTTTTTTTTRSSSGSLTSSGSNSRPLSLEDELDRQQNSDEFLLVERKASTGGFWLFGRNSVDQGYLKDGSSGFGTLQRSPRHFSFEDLNSTTSSSSATVKLKKQVSTLSIDSSTVRMQREGSQNSLASSIFRKDFWKPINTTAGGMSGGGGGRNPLLNFNSDPSMLSSSSSAATITERKVSSFSLMIHPSPSLSSDTTSHYQHPLHKNRHTLISPHPLDNSPTTADTLQSEISSFTWD